MSRSAGLDLPSIGGNSTAISGGGGGTPTDGRIRGGAFFGDGADGDVVFDGVSAVTGASRSGTVYTMTRSVAYNSMTVDSGVTVMAAAPIFVKETLTNNGTISLRGEDGLPDGTPGASPIAALAAIGVGAGAAGGAGGQNGGSAGGDEAGVGLTGGTGGTGSSGAGGRGGTFNTFVNGSRYWMLKSPKFAGMGADFGFGDQVMRRFGDGGDRYQGGGGGGGGGGNGTDFGGGGGGGGGVMIISAQEIVNTGTITAAGGDGGAAQAVGCGGGGGGSGGLIFLYYKTLTDSGTITTAGGTGGANF